ncbi:MAG: hypothetical protein J6W81_02785 [Lentisphaeria bacterium]|nr:hypothetical protein [Lentisphaeria bacterium]
MDSEYRNLLSLLDDENEQSACLAMAELLKRDESKLEPVLRKLQESSNLRLRRRIHQLQSTILLRRRRKSFSDNLSSCSLDLLEGLIQLHLLWFDNDSPESLRKQWGKLVIKAEKFQPSTLESLAFFMQKTGLKAVNRDDFDPEHLCLGTVLDNSAGSDFMLCCIAVLLAAKCGIRLRITQSAETDFILIDDYENVLVPANDWDYMPNDGTRYTFELWSVPMLLRYAAALLFTAAVSADSFRYIHTIGACLNGSSSPEGVAFLPYPYGSAK